MGGGVPGSQAGSGLGARVTGAMSQSPIFSALSTIAGQGQPTGPQPTDGIANIQSLPPAPVDGQQTAAIQQTPPAAGGYSDMITRAAQKWGVDPTTALRVAKAEGGTDRWIQSKVPGKRGGTEPSYGPFQMLIGGGQTGYPEGMGNQIIRERGIDPRDPRNAEQVIDFAMEQASKHGWSQWYGAKAAGIGNMDGIGGRPSGVSPMTKTVMGGVQSPSDPAAYQQSLTSRMFGGEMQPGQGEQLQKSLMGEQQTAGGGGGFSMQQAQASESGPAQVQDDSGELLSQTAAEIQARKQGTGGRAAERKQALRQRIGGR